ETGVGQLAQGARGAGDGRARRVVAPRVGAAVRPHARAVAVPVHAIGHDLRRIRRDPEEHHRGAGARPASRAEAGEEVTAVPAPPPYPKAHDLLEGRVVLVTASAGSGIGFATAKRAQEEGATVVVSDKHE